MMNPEAPNANQSQPVTTTDQTPWWMKIAVRFLGGVSAVGALVLGAMTCLTVSAQCLLAGILLMLIGVVVALIEAPFLCMFLDFAQAPARFFDSKPSWYKGLLYIILSILPLALCAKILAFFGSGLIFITGALYGVIALGKKAPAEQMRMTASSSYNLLQNSRGGDVEMGSTQPKIVSSPKSGAI